MLESEKCKTKRHASVSKKSGTLNLKAEKKRAKTCRRHGGGGVLMLVNGAALVPTRDWLACTVRYYIALHFGMATEQFVDSSGRQYAKVLLAQAAEKRASS